MERRAFASKPNFSTAQNFRDIHILFYGRLGWLGGVLCFGSQLGCPTAISWSESRKVAMMITESLAAMAYLVLFSLLHIFPNLLPW